MNAIGDGVTGYLVLLGIALIAHEPWRWLGLVLARNVSVGSEVFVWVRAVATALVAGLVMRLLLFPAGILADVPLMVRLGALAIGIATFVLTGRNLGGGIFAGVVGMMIAAQLWPAG